MSKLNPLNLPKTIAWFFRGTWRNAERVIPRAYALALAFVICFLTYQAVSYLIVGLLKPSGSPPQITQLPRRMDATLFEVDRRKWRGLDATANPRTPPSHYHRIGDWIEPDHQSGCTTSGCHSPLPHNERKEVRAFLNMHATSIHCGTCHMKSDRAPLSLTWYNLASGDPQGPPAILQAYDLLTSDEYEKQRNSPDDAFQDKLTSLLRKAAREADNLPALENLADHVNAVRATSDEFKQLLIQARESLPRHFRGEYGAKIAVRGVGGDPVLSHPDTEKLVAQYVSQKDTIKGQDRRDLLNRIHPLRRKSPLDCTECHRKQDGLIDFARMGYPPARANALVDPIVVEMIEHINKGTPFHMPDFIGVEK
ncbi:MAG: hypothetical protein H6818_20275 [Phycisphaerales bacterium]|nr:hypothetical protein [Phycisphaerales bacterium]MCB9864125.1 hypothetical protein [Phycisphaerales bacterium]